MRSYDTPNRRRAHRGAVVLTSSVLLFAAMTTIGVCLEDVQPAHAAKWMQTACVNPNQSAAPSQGWGSFTTGSPGYGSNNSVVCGPGDPMLAILSTAAPASVGTGENLQYTPPSGSTLTGGQVDVGMYANGGGYDASGTAVAYTPEFAYNGSNVIFQCAHGLTPCANNTNEYIGVLDLPSDRGGNFYIGAGCGGASGATCDEGGSNGAWALVQVYWADFLLSNTATPAASNITGTLLSAGARGERELVFTASDPSGPGVYQIIVEADGTSLYHATPDSNSGWCAAVGESDGALMFDASQPCKQSESVDLAVNTALLHDGPHTLKITIQDAAQNSSVVYDSTITTHNAPENNVLPAITPGQPTVGATLTVTAGEWSAPSSAGTVTYTYQWEDCDTQAANCQAIPGAQTATYTPASSDVGHTLRATVTAQNNDGSTVQTSKQTTVVPAIETPVLLTQNPTTPATPGSTTQTITPPSTPSTTGATSGGSGGGGGTPNGTPASELAILHVNGPAAITRSYQQRAFKLTGQLTNNQAQPIAGATLDVLAQTVGTSTLKLIAHATTAANGTFALTVPAGPSRMVEIAYRALSGDPGYAALARVHEAVHASATLKITPRTISPTGTIVLQGRVQGPIPPQGTIVELLVHYRGHWEPFRDPRTNKGGYYHITYQFQGAIGCFPFRAQLPAGQTGYPYSTGYSNTVNVTTG